MDIRSYLRGKGYQWSEENRPSGLNAVMNCPFCEDKERKFAINITNGAFNCAHQNKCGITGSWFDFQKLHNDEPLSVDGNTMIQPTAKKVYQLPRPVSFKTPIGKSLNFLTDRGFTVETIKKYKIAQTEDGQSIAIPYYKNGKLVNVKYRTIDGKGFTQERGTEPTLWNRDNISTETNYLIITEGEFDALALCQYGFDAVSMPGGASNMEWIETEWDFIGRFKDIILCFDMDDAGEKGVLQAVKRLGEWRCKRAILPFKDANMCLINGVSKLDMVNAFAKAQDFKPTMLMSASDFTEEIIHMIENPQSLQGTPTAFAGLSEYLGGWRPCEMTVWSGKNASGKSTILNQEIINLALRHIGSCIASLEMPPARYLRWAMVQYTGLNHPSPDDVRKAMDRIGKYIYVINSYEECDIETLTDLFRYAARRYGVKHFIIDSLMRVKMDEKSELSEQKKVCNKLSSLAKEYNAHAHLVAHPRKGTDDDDKPGKVDVKGNAHITDIADNVLIMWRPSEDLKEKARAKGKGDAMDAKLYIKKNRELGTEGSIKLWFDPQTKRFLEEKGEV